MHRDTLEELRDAQLRYLKTWLDGEGGEAIWMALGRAGWERLVSTPLAELVDRQRLDALIEAVLSEETLQKAARPLARRLLVELSQRTRTREETLEELVGHDALAACEALAARTDLIDEAMLRRLAADPGLETVMRDVLYDALFAFHERTNPFVAPWGVPALLDALPAIGRGAVRKAFDGVRGEFERRLEPEMRKFLAGFAKKSLQTAVDATTERAAESDLVAWRQRVARVLLSQPLNEAVWSLEEPRGEQLLATFELAMAHALGQPAVRELVTASIEALWNAHAEQSLREVADAWGVAIVDPDPLIQALWPLARTVLADEGGLAIVGRGIDEAHQAWLANQSG